MSVFLLVGIVPFATLGIITKVVATQTLEAQAYRQLITVREMMIRDVKNYFTDAVTQMKIFSRSTDVLQFLSLAKHLHGVNDKPDAPFDLTSYQYLQISEEFGANILQFWKDRGYADILLMCADHGHVQFSCLKETDLGTNLSGGPYKDSGLARLWKKVVQTKKAAIVDFQPYAPSSNKPAAFAGYPVFGDQEKLIGVIAFQIPIEHINAITNQRGGMGKTQITYLVGPDKLMRSDAFKNSDRFSVKTSFENPETGKIDSEGVREALAGRSGEKINPGF